jgi:hypothetical protein
MIPYIIAAGVGYLLNELVNSNKTKSTVKVNNDFFVFVRSDDFGKSTLLFSEYSEAKKVYDKFAAKKKVRYKDLVDFDPSERKLYNQWKSEGNIGKEGYPSSLSDESKIQEISFGQGNKDFESKEL